MPLHAPKKVCGMNKQHMGLLSKIAAKVGAKLFGAAARAGARRIGTRAVGAAARQGMRHTAQLARRMGARAATQAAAALPGLKTQALEAAKKSGKQAATAYATKQGEKYAQQAQAAWNARRSGAYATLPQNTLDQATAMRDPTVYGGAPEPTDKEIRAAIRKSMQRHHGSKKHMRRMIAKEFGAR